MRRQRAADVRVSGAAALPLPWPTSGRVRRRVRRLSDLLLSGRVPVSRKIILRLANSSADRQRYELGQMRRGKRPLAAKTDVFDAKD